MKSRAVRAFVITTVSFGSLLFLQMAACTALVGLCAVSVAWFERGRPTEAERRLAAHGVIEVVAWRWYAREPFAVARGRVKNAGTVPLEDLRATVSWHAPDGTLVSISEVPLRPANVGPGEESRFVAYDHLVPEMDAATVEFSAFRGIEIRCTPEGDTPRARHPSGTQAGLLR